MSLPLSTQVFSVGFGWISQKRCAFAFVGWSQSQANFWLSRTLQLYCICLSALLLWDTLHFVRNKLYDCIQGFTAPEFPHNVLVRDISLCESHVLIPYRNMYLKEELPRNLLKQSSNSSKQTRRHFFNVLYFKVGFFSIIVDFFVSVKFFFGCRCMKKRRNNCGIKLEQIIWQVLLKKQKLQNGKQMFGRMAHALLIHEGVNFS